MDMHYLMCDCLNRNNTSYIVGVSHLKKKNATSVQLPNLEMQFSF